VVERLLLTIAGIVGVAVIALVVLFAIGWVHSYRNPAASMEPTFHCARPAARCEGSHDDRFLTFGFHFSAPHRGDVVAFKTPPLAAVRCGVGGTFVKRIVALPGETFAERDGFVLIDGKPLAEPYVADANRDRLTIRPVRVPPGRYFLLGDNRVASCDSREWGAVPRGSLIGKVVALYWPPGRIRIV
jgi:signal peptidase I